MTSAQPLLSVREVSHRFGGLQALERVSFDLYPGEVLGIIGPNGAGKSTLFGVITGYIRPDRGRVTFREAPLNGLAPETIARRGVVRTFQTPRPFQGMRFIDNVVVAALSRTHRLEEARAEAERCLDQVRLLPWREVPALGASTGQRKRLDIARALATRPQVLLLDEPLGGIDPGNLETVIDLLLEIRRQGVTLMVIEHNLEAVGRFVDRLVALNLGRKVTEGSPAEVTRDPRVVQAYLGADEEEHA